MDDEPQGGNAASETPKVPEFKIQGIFPGRMVSRVFASIMILSIILVIVVAARIVTEPDSSVFAVAILTLLLISVMGVVLYRLIPAFGMVVINEKGVNVVALIGGAQMEWKDITAVEVWYEADDVTDARIKIVLRADTPSFVIRSFYNRFNEMVKTIAAGAEQQGVHVKDRRPKVE